MHGGRQGGHNIMKHELPFVYRSTDAGKVNQWRSWAEETDDGGAVLCTEFGQVGGKLRTTRREVTKAGRHDTLYGKAKHDATKKWEDKQSKEGYVTELGEDDADAAPDAKKRKVDASDVPVLPMLAKVAEFRDEAVKGLAWPCFVQPKIDGFRCVARVCPTDGVGLFSRKNIRYIGFPSMHDILGDIELPETGFGSGKFHLDGEFYINGMEFNALSGLIKRGQHHDDYDLEELEFRVFDCFDLDHMHTPFSERIAFAQEVLGDLPARVHALETHVVSSIAESLSFMERFLKAGHEGLMFRGTDSPYVLRKRSSHLLKLKEFEEEEFTIVGFNEAAGADAGSVVWECETHDGKKQFSVRPMGTLEHRTKLFEDADNHVGRLLTVKYQNLSKKDNVPRFPVGKEIRDP